MEQQNLYNLGYGPIGGGISIYAPFLNGVYSRPVKSFICPSDPSAPNGGTLTVNGGYTVATCSYGFNALIFCKPGITFTTPPTKSGSFDPQGDARIPATFQDGTSNTIVITEKLAQCSNSTWKGIGGNWWAYSALSSPPLPPPMQPPPLPYYPGFEISFFTAYPGGGTAIGLPSLFQIQPSPYLTNCDPLRASTGHTSVIQACLGDGSVRSLQQGMSPTTWWWACTPSGGEVLGSDW
jgi:hypothetical protein